MSLVSHFCERQCDKGNFSDLHIKKQKLCCDLTYLSQNNEAQKWLICHNA